MLTHTFNSFAPCNKPSVRNFTENEVKNEPMLWQCDVKTAWELGGPITKAFIAAMLEDSSRYMFPNINYDNVIIDSRVHMLMKGWYSCIPGFHHDLVPRTRSDSQPNYTNPAYHAKHCMMLINGDICPTEFAIGKATFNDVPIGQKYYKEWHKEVVEKLKSGELRQMLAPSNSLIFFDWQTWHQGTAAVGNGWRFFIRASWNHNEKPKNELRRQCQVYLSPLEEGW
jgi:hypothetical protein